MNYDWYLIFNQTEFLALDLVSKEYVLDLQDIGQKTIKAFSGNLISICYEGVFLSVNLNQKNPFKFDSHAVYIDENQNVYLGVLVED